MIFFQTNNLFFLPTSLDFFCKIMLFCRYDISNIYVEILDKASANYQTSKTKRLWKSSTIARRILGPGGRRPWTPWSSVRRNDNRSERFGASDLWAFRAFPDISRCQNHISFCCMCQHDLWLSGPQKCLGLQRGDVEAGRTCVGTPKQTCWFGTEMCWCLVYLRIFAPCTCSFLLDNPKAVERCLIFRPFPTDDGARMSYPLRLNQIDHDHTYKPHIQCSYAYLLLA